MFLDMVELERHASSIILKRQFDIRPFFGRCKSEFCPASFFFIRSINFEDISILFFSAKSIFEGRFPSPAEIPQGHELHNLFM